MRRIVFASTLALLACSSDEGISPNVVDPPAPPWAPAAESCDPPVPGAVKTCQECSLGTFGRWVLDDAGLPAYEYGLDENADPRAAFFDTEMLDRREHWHELGNRRVTALAYNDGYIEVTEQDRGITYLDKFDEAHGNYAGGYSYVDDGKSTWTIA